MAKISGLDKKTVARVAHETRFLEDTSIINYSQIQIGKRFLQDSSQTCTECFMYTSYICSHTSLPDPNNTVW